jgi:hypothetical protein
MITWRYQQCTEHCWLDVSVGYTTYLSVMKQEERIKAGRMSQCVRAEAVRLKNKKLMNET